MASFQAKIGWKSSRKKENKNYLSDQFLPDPEYRIPKKLQKKSLWLLFEPKQVGKCQKDKNKNYRSDQFLLDLL